MCIGEKKKKMNDLLQKIETMSQQKKKKKSTIEALRSQEGFLEEVIPELSLMERAINYTEQHSYEWAVGGY